MKNTGKAKGIVDGMSMAIAFLVIIVIIIVVPLIFGGSDNSPGSDKTTTGNTTASQTQGSNEALEQMDEGYVGPGKSWITKSINYNSKLRTDGYSIVVRYSKKGGGWTEPMSFPKRGNITPDPLPVGITNGPALVTAGPEEIETYKVTLYRVTYK